MRKTLLLAAFALFGCTSAFAQFVNFVGYTNEDWFSSGNNLSSPVSFGFRTGDNQPVTAFTTYKSPCFTDGVIDCWAQASATSPFVGKNRTGVTGWYFDGNNGWQIFDTGSAYRQPTLNKRAVVQIISIDRQTMWHCDVVFTQADTASMNPGTNGIIGKITHVHTALGYELTLASKTVYGVYATKLAVADQNLEIGDKILIEVDSNGDASHDLTSVRWSCVSL